MADTPAKQNDNPRLTTAETLIRRFPLVWFFVAWLIGVYLSHNWLNKPWTAIVVIVIASLAFIALRRLQLNFPKQACLSLIIVVPLASLYSLLQRPPECDSLSKLATRKAVPVGLRGMIEDAAVWSPNPYYRESDRNSSPWSTRWRVRWNELRDGDTWIEIQSTTNLLTIGRITSLLPGDRIEAYGNLEAITAPTNPGSPDFASAARAKGMFASVSTDAATQILKLDSTWQMPNGRLRGQAVRAVDAGLHNCVAFDQAEMAAALVFGQREQVDWESQQQLMATGTLHMLAISGMHVEIIAVTLLILCQLFSIRRGATALLVIGVCMAYSGLAGSNPPVLRALIQIVAFTIASYWGMNARLFNLLAMSALILSLQNIANLTNVGVQLSFLAVATIGIFNRDSRPQRRSALESLLEENLSWRRRWILGLGRQLMAGIKISFWIGLLTTPLIWHHFHVVSIVSIPLNVVLSIPLMIGLLCGLLTGLLAWIPWIGFALGKLLGFVCGACLALIQNIVEFSYNIPLGHIWLPSPPIWWSCTFYAVLVVWLAAARGGYRILLGTILSGWILVGVGLFATGPRGFLGGPSDRMALENSELRCTFIDVGHGTSVIIEWPDGQIWLYDAGHMGVRDRSHEVIANTLWSLPTARIDTLIISHADSDHYNATVGLLKRFHVGRVVSTQRFWDSSAREVMQTRQAIWRAGVPRETWSNNAIADNDRRQSAATVLHPSADFRGETDNADSLCLQIEHADVRILLPGDIEGSGMVALCDQQPRNCQIMMAPHHGSIAYDASPILEWCRPTTVVISGNQRAARPEVIARYSDARMLGITFLHGAVQIRVQSDGTHQTYHWSEGQWQKLAE